MNDWYHRSSTIMAWTRSSTSRGLWSYPRRYYRNSTCKSRNLIACAVKANVKHFYLLVDRSGLRHALRASGGGAGLRPTSPYGSSKIMTEIMLRDTAAASPVRYVSLRYFNAAGADLSGKTRRLSPISSRSPCRRRSVGDDTLRSSARTHRLLHTYSAGAGGGGGVRPNHLFLTFS
jgi:nucleoside-diphosphate-sugar epimerase